MVWGNPYSFMWVCAQKEGELHAIHWWLISCPYLSLWKIAMQRSPKKSLAMYPSWISDDFCIHETKIVSDCPLKSHEFPISPHHTRRIDVWAAKASQRICCQSGLPGRRICPYTMKPPQVATLKLNHKRMDLHGFTLKKSGFAHEKLGWQLIFDRFLLVYNINNSH